MKVNKQEVVSAVAGMVDLPKNKTEEVLNAVLKVIADELSSGEKVQLFGFGNFEVSNRAARMGVNPKTKEKIKIAASKSVKFKVAKALKDAVK